MHKRILVLFFAAILIFAGCSEQKDSPAPESPPEVQPTGNTYFYNFDPREVIVGDLVGDNWLVAKKEVSSNNDPFFADFLFRGEVEISGLYTVYDEKAGDKAGKVTFAVNQDFKKSLPKLKVPAYDTERGLLFEFSNPEEARKAFGEPGSKGIATVRVSDYHLRYTSKQSVDQAKLVEVVSKEETEIDLDFIMENAKLGMNKDDVIAWFGRPLDGGVFHLNGQDYWRLDIGAPSDYKYTELEADSEALISGKVKYQLFLAWNKAARLISMDVFYKGEDGNVDSYIITAS